MKQCVPCCLQARSGGLGTHHRTPLLRAFGAYALEGRGLDSQCETWVHACVFTREVALGAIAHGPDNLSQPTTHACLPADWIAKSIFKWAIFFLLFPLWPIIIPVSARV
jgi:hypothetical protein